MQRDSMLAATVMCLTQDGLGLSHPEQVRRLCAGGARWIQLRMKGADRVQWLHEARQCAAACKAHGKYI